MTPTFHYLARAIIIEANHVLLVREKGSALSYLPGGHVEAGESISLALRREIREELGLSCEVREYLGAVEHEWGPVHENYEINHIFHIQLHGVTPQQAPVSCETHLEFFWSPVADLEKNKIQPYPLSNLITNWVNGDVSAWWASTLQELVVDE